MNMPATVIDMFLLQCHLMSVYNSRVVNVFEFLEVQF